jgi:hypothetical protein
VASASSSLFPLAFTGFLHLLLDDHLEGPRGGTALGGIRRGRLGGKNGGWVRSLHDEGISARPRRFNESGVVANAEGGKARANPKSGRIIELLARERFEGSNFPVNHSGWDAMTVLGTSRPALACCCSKSVGPSAEKKIDTDRMCWNSGKACVPPQQEYRGRDRRQV